MATRPKRRGSTSGGVRAPRLICVGHAALDRIYQIDEFPKSPTKLRASNFLETGGGMAATAAVAIARLGGHVALWSRAGRDLAAEIILAELKHEGVDVAYVRQFDGARSSTSAIIVDRRGERLIVTDRAEGTPSDTGWLPLDQIAKADAILADKRWPEAAVAALSRARSCGIPGVLDADVGANEAMPDMLAVTDFAIFATLALDDLMGQGDDGPRLRKVLDRFGCKHAGVTRGSRGYFWLETGGKLRHQPAYKVKVVDTTGAGDAFHGAFTFALAEGRPSEECARLASAVSALKCTKLGGRPGLPSLNEAMAFIAQHRS